MYQELLKTCGFEAAEIEKEGARIGKAFEIAGIDEEDVKRGESRVRRYFDVELEGVRKILGAWIKEFTDLVLAKEEGKFVVYLSFPPVPHVAATLAVASESVHAGPPELTIDTVLGQIFGKINPVLETAEGCGLPPGLANCSLLQCRVGAIERGIIPKPDLTIVSGFLCDQAPKQDEVLLHEKMGVPVAYMDSCVDDDWKKWPVPAPRRVAYFAREIRDAMEKFHEITGVQITEAMVAAGANAYGALSRVFTEINDLLKADPMPLGANSFGMFAYFMRSATKRALMEGPAAADLLLREVKERVREGKGVLEKGVPRVMFYLYHFTDPGIMDMIEGSGLAVVVTTLSGVTSTATKSDYPDVYERVADVNLRRGTRHSDLGFSTEWAILSRDWNVDGVIVGYHFSCRGAAAPAFMTKKMLDEAGIPSMLLEFDLYDTRTYSPETMRTRVETFAEVLRERKKSKAQLERQG